MAPMMRIGFGYDVHRLVAGRRLILGGVEIPHDQGLEGHSDADVLLHAICDGILGALGEGDIGVHFPNTDPRYQGLSSLRLLSNVAQKMVEHRFLLANLDSTLVAEKPRMAPYIPQMIANIADVFRVSRSAIQVKATTSEGLGFVGEGKGIVAFAVVLLAPSGKAEEFSGWRDR